MKQEGIGDTKSHWLHGNRSIIELLESLPQQITTSSLAGTEGKIREMSEKKKIRPSLNLTESSPIPSSAMYCTAKFMSSI